MTDSRNAVRPTIAIESRRRRGDFGALEGAILDCEAVLRRAPGIIECELGRAEREIEKQGLTEVKALDARQIAEAEKKCRLQWLELAKESVANARRALADRVLDQGWHHVQAAYRCEVFWVPREQLEVWIRPLRYEADKKLSGWRNKAVRDLIGGDAKMVSAYALHTALQIRDGDAANQYRKVRLLKEKLTLLAAMLLGLLIALLYWSAYTGVRLWPSATSDSAGVTAGSPATLAGWEVLLGVALFGALAGGLSAIMPISLKNNRGSVPQQLMTWSVTMLRPLIGAVAALGAHALMQAGVVTVGHGSPAALWAIAFLAGFSEKWIVAKIAPFFGGGGQDADDQGKSPPSPGSAQSRPEANG